MKDRSQWEKYEGNLSDSIWMFPLGDTLELSYNGQKVFQKLDIFCGVHHFEPFSVTLGFLLKLEKIPVPFYIGNSRWRNWGTHHPSKKCAVYIYGEEVSMLLSFLSDDFVEYVMSLQSD